MYIVIIQFRRSDEQVNYHKEAHKNFLKKQIDEGNFIVSGNRTPNTGEVILSCLPDMETLYQILHEDPFYKNRIGQYEIIEFEPDIKCQELTYLIDEREENT